ncbi:lytic transglycosylase domain-containing protein [Salmonella enterica]|nr:transglycosylase [Salmonella enterica]EAX6601643.1 lytic transglycosylase domain-containing protein [Salmonella enterica]
MASRYALIGLMLAVLPAAQATETIPAGYHRVAKQTGVPADWLYAVTLAESGSRVSQAVRPWPWTLNIAGKGYRYASQDTACTALHQFMQTTHPRRIDVGLGQINLGWNGQLFSTPCGALVPYANLQVCAQLLRHHYDRWHNWPEAVGRYHHPAGGKPAQRYRQKVLRYRHTLSSTYQKGRS